MLTNSNFAKAFNSKIVTVFIEVVDMFSLTVNQLRRKVRVRESHGSKTRLPNKSNVIALCLGDAIDLKVDFTDCVAPSLPAFGGGQYLGVENDLHCLLPNYRSGRPGGHLAISGHRHDLPQRIALGPARTLARFFRPIVSVHGAEKQ